MLLELLVCSLDFKQHQIFQSPENLPSYPLVEQVYSVSLLERRAMSCHVSLNLFGNSSRSSLSQRAIGVEFVLKTNVFTIRIDGQNFL